MEGTFTPAIDFVKSHAIWLGVIIVLIIIIAVLFFSKSEPMKTPGKNLLADPKENVELLIDDILRAQEENAAPGSND